jgi:hypothetical protein
MVLIVRYIGVLQKKLGVDDPWQPSIITSTLFYYTFIDIYSSLT